MQFLIPIFHPSEEKRMLSRDRPQRGNCEKDLALEKQPTTATALRGEWASETTCLWGHPAVCPSDMEPKRIREGYLVKRVSKVSPAMVTLGIGWGRIGVQLWIFYCWNRRVLQVVEGCGEKQYAFHCLLVLKGGRFYPRCQHSLIMWDWEFQNAGSGNPSWFRASFSRVMPVCYARRLKLFGYRGYY